ncbi:MAG: hypothetical protein ABIZ49_05005, partial [Opitutaceae bacterium]
MVLIVLSVVAGIGLRWRHLGAQFDHFDEAFPSALIARARATGNLDMNVRDAEVPAIAKYNLYTSSSYHYAVLAWDTVMRVFPGWPNDQPTWPSLLRLRAFSALLASAALVLFAIATWRILGPTGGSVATALMAFNPTLVQDAHYARPEGLLTVLTVVYLTLLGYAGPPSFRRIVSAGLALGVLMACKNTMGILCLTPLIWFWSKVPRKEAFVSLCWLGVAALLAFLATCPGIWMHYSDYRQGVLRLQTMYSHAFPVNGPPDAGVNYRMALAYFTATLGAGTAALAVVGAVAWFRQRAWPLVWLWLVPAILFAVYFGSKTIFFERAYSPILPGVFLTAGAGAAALTAMSRSRLVAAIALAAIMPGAMVSARFVGDTLSGAAEKQLVAFESRLVSALPNVPIIVTPMWAEAHLASVADQWKTTGAPFIVRVLDYNDAWTAPMYTAMLRRLPAHEFAIIPGPFHDFPVSTLQVYHVPTSRYVWIGPSPIPATLPPTSMMNSVLLRPLEALLKPTWRYHAFAIVAGALTLSLAWWTLGRQASSTSEEKLSWIFAVSVVLTLFAFRWPGFFHHPELNVDEAHTVAAALTLGVNPVYWKSVDGTTHGPLNDFILLVPGLFGWPVNFLTARIVGCALISGALIWFWAGMRRMWGDGVACLAVLPPLAFFSFSTFWDFVHYTSEHLTIFLLTMGWSLLAIAARNPPARRLRDAWL